MLIEFSEKYNESVFDITPNFMRVTFIIEEKNLGKEKGLCRQAQ